jgi:hypothetical protein
MELGAELRLVVAAVVNWPVLVSTVSWLIDLLPWLPT